MKPLSPMQLPSKLMNASIFYFYNRSERLSTPLCPILFTLLLLMSDDKSTSITELFFCKLLKNTSAPACLMLFEHKFIL